jgi:hypothetical protein
MATESAIDGLAGALDERAHSIGHEARARPERACFSGRVSPAVAPRSSAGSGPRARPGFCCRVIAVVSPGARRTPARNGTAEPPRDRRSERGCTCTALAGVSATGLANRRFGVRRKSIAPSSKATSDAQGTCKVSLFDTTAAHPPATEALPRPRASGSVVRRTGPGGGVHTLAARALAADDSDRFWATGDYDDAAPQGRSSSHRVPAGGSATLSSSRSASTARD